MALKSEKIGRDSATLRFLYKTIPGRLILKPLSSRAVSKLVGAFLDSRMSKFLIKGFLKKNNISADEYVLDGFSSFNDCFARRLQDGERPIDISPTALISPCDGRLSIYKINDGLVLPIKQSEYSVSDLLKTDGLAEKYKNGVCLVFRLCVDNYHRYCYIDNGSKDDNVFIPGKLHTVRPVALERRKVFCENCREYTVMQTENFGDVTQIEVGALLVGKIQNHHGKSEVRRGEEKGTFLYGGSTIVLLLEQDKVDISNDYFSATENGYEVIVKMGEKIGNKSNGRNDT